MKVSSASLWAFNKFGETYNHWCLFSVWPVMMPLQFKDFGQQKNLECECCGLTVHNLYWQMVPTITRDTGGLGACRGLENLIAVHQITVILVSCLCIHNGDIWNDGN